MGMSDFSLEEGLWWMVKENVLSREKNLWGSEMFGFGFWGSKRGYSLMIRSLVEFFTLMLREFNAFR